MLPGSIRIYSSARVQCAVSRSATPTWPAAIRSRVSAPTAHAMTQPTQPRPRADRRYCPPRPPLAALPDSIRIYSSARVQCAATRRATPTWLAAVRFRTSAHCSTYNASATAARGSMPPPTTAASEGDPGGYQYLRLMARLMRRGAPCRDYIGGAFLCQVKRQSCFSMYSYICRARG